MTVVQLKHWSESDQAAIRQQLDRILKSGPFHQSQRRQRFLEYLVNETLAGRGERLKAYNVALEVFERPETFDPITDPLVRIEAARLREKLREYYGTEGQSDAIHIDLPKGTYAPLIEFREGEQLSKRRMRWQTTVPVLALILMLGAGGAWLTRDLWMPAPQGAVEHPAIAVLPFVNLSGDPAGDRLADALTENVITNLSLSRDLFVIARNSTLTYKDRSVDPRQIGRELGVMYILEGSIQASSDRVRITAQLIEAASGRHVWSNRYDRPLEDIFAIQDEVSEKVAGTLTGWEGAIAEAQRAMARRKPPANLQAYDYYLLGIEAKHKETKEDNIRAQELFRKALELDPRFARAYTGLALTYGYEIWLSYTESRARSLRDWLAAVQKAVALDPYDGEAHMVLGYAYRMLNDHERATPELDRGLELQPNSPDLLMLYVENLPMLGNPQKGVELAERAIRLNPNYPAWYLYGLHRVYYFAGEFEKALAAARQAPGLSGPLLAAIYGHLGRNAEAAEGAANVLKLDPDWSAERDISDTGAFARQAELDLYLDGIRKAGLPVCASATALQQRPEMKRLPICEQARAAL